MKQNKQESKTHFQIAVIGGGLAGLIAAYLLHKKGFSVVLFEKSSYPFHRVCGEYVSNEVKDFLQNSGLYPSDLAVENIIDFELTSIRGTTAKVKLPLGGFGISRYAFDHFLFQKVQEAGITILQNSRVQNVNLENDRFHIVTDDALYTSDICLAAWGKRDRLDKTLVRPFSLKKSPFVGVKYHVELDFPSNRIALHNFEGGYCGISRVEENRVNVCYLVSREVLRKAGSIERLETDYLRKNPFLDEIWNKAKFLFEKPLVINEVSFEPKTPVENHILMIGDTAGLITPLCGNGMAMAIHSAKIVAEVIDLNFKNGQLDRNNLEMEYSREWNNTFAFRLKAGRFIQRLFGNFTSSLAVRLLKISPALARKIVSLTHGKPI